MPENLARVSALTGPAPEMMQLIMAFSALRKENDRAISALSSAHGISATDLRALSFVSTTDRATPKATAQHLGITTGSLTTLADRLEEAGYLVRAANPADRRSVFLQVTAKGAAVMDEVNALYVRAFSEAFDTSDIPWMKEAFLELAEALGRLAD